MIVYGDHARIMDPAEMLAAIRLALEAAACADGVVRHDLLVTALIEAGALAQGLADAAMQTRGCDGVQSLETDAMAVVLAIARQVDASWETSFHASGRASDAGLSALAARLPPTSITVKQPEGYAHYALYPEAYAAAGRSLPPDARVIGLRSVGTSLAAMVAAGAKARAPLTLRPVGHPFRREVRLDAALEVAILEGAPSCLGIVDEGPGLSGSSMNTVADWLETAGVAPDRIVFFPGHRGPLGPEALPRHAARWSLAKRRVVDFEDVILPRLSEAVADLTGPPLGAIEDLSGGVWRTRFYDTEAAWPPVHAMQERRKFLLRTASGDWLLRFAGLGSLGEDALRRACSLHQAGFAPEPLGIRLGFLVQRWRSDAVPLRLEAVDRQALIDHLGRYLGYRSTLAARGAGASVSDLAEMTSINIREALGPAAEAAWRRRYGDGPSAPPPRPVETDNRLHAWEWLRCADGRLLKTDAIDHHRSHDLVGCQDIGWDVAGAAVEFECSNPEVERLVAAVERASGYGVNRRLLDWLAPAYLAFQIGLWTIAADQAAEPERARIRTLLDAYAAALNRHLRS